jgi:hypothetical protein
MRRQTETPQNGPLVRRVPFPAAGLLLSGYDCVAGCRIQLKADHTWKCFVKLVACVSTNTLVADSSAVDRLLARRKSNKAVWLEPPPDQSHESLSYQEKKV